MTSTVTIDDKNIATIDMTVEKDLVKQTYERTLRAYGQNVNIAGFRRGKAPNNVVEKYVGVERIKAEVIDRLFPTEFQKAIDENKLNIAYRPNLETVDFELGKDLKLKAKVELKPDFKLAKYKDVEVKYEEFKHPDNAIDNELNLIQRRYSTLDKKDGAADDKDTVVFDFEGYVGDEKIEHGSGTNYTLDLANSNFIPGFAEGLVGHSAGEEFDINVTFPENYHEEKLKGAKATFKIKLHEIKTRNMPELNDELAKKAGKDTLELLKQDIQQYLDNVARDRNDRIKSDAIFNKIVEETKIEIQPAMLEREYEAVLNEAKLNTQQQGADFDEMMKREGKENVEKRLHEEAQKRIINSLIVEKIVTEVDIKIEQKDIMEHINKMSMVYNVPANQLFEQLRKNPNAYAVMSQQILANKVNDYLLENNKFITK